MMIHRSICSFLFLLFAANAVVAQDSTKTTFQSNSIDLQYGPAGWYSFSGDLELLNNRHALKLRAYNSNITTGGQTYSVADRNAVFDHSLSYSNLFSAQRGVNRYGSMGMTYDFKIPKTVDLNVTYNLYDRRKVATDTFYREFLPGLAPGNVIRGRDSIDYRYQAHEISALLKLYPSKNRKDIFQYSFDYDISKNNQWLSSQAQLFHSPDSIMQNMYNREDGNYLKRKRGGGIFYQHYFRYSKISGEVDYSETDYTANTHVKSLLQTDTVPYLNDYFFTHTSSQKNVRAGLKYEFRIIKIIQSEISYHYSDLRTNGYRYLDSLGTAVNDSFFSSQYDLHHTVHMAALSLSASYRAFYINFTGGYGSYHYLNTQTLPDTLSNPLSYKNYNLQLNFRLRLKAGKTINLSFSSRPSYAGEEMLSPYYDYQIPFSWASGNLFLGQEIKNAANLSYEGNGWKGIKINLTASGSRTENAICPVGQIALSDTTLSNGITLPAGTIFYTYRNFDYEDLVQSQLRTEFRITSKFFITLAPLFKYQRIPSAANDITGDMKHSTLPGTGFVHPGATGRFPVEHHFQIRVS